MKKIPHTRLAPWKKMRDLGLLLKRVKKIYEFL